MATDEFSPVPASTVSCGPPWSAREETLVRFMMFVARDDQPDTDLSDGPGIDTWVASTEARGQRVLGEVLEPAREATTVRVRDGGATRTTETVTDAVLGFDVLECADLDEAVAIAAAHPMARSGRIELRPFAVFD